MWYYISILSACVCIVLPQELPDYLKDKRCSLTKDLKSCVIKNGNLAIPLIANGDAKYHIPPLKPMTLSSIKLISTPNLQLNLTDIKIHGLDRLTITNIKFDWDKNLFTITLRGSNVTIEGLYSADGHILVMPVKGSGRFSMILKNGEYKVTSTTEIIDKNGVKYHRPTSCRLTYKFGGIDFDFENLFAGNSMLSKEVNKFLNENWDVLLDDFGPGIADTISTIIRDIFEKFSDQVPIKNFFLE